MKLSPDQGGEWGILGGTFDPVHIGHLTLANQIYLQKELTGVLLVPSIRHPFKKSRCHASYMDRLEMLKLAIQEDDHLVVSEIESEKDLSGYTLDTVRALKLQYPRTMFYFIVGADNLTELDKWHNPELIFKEIKILVGSRPGYNEKQLAALPSERVELVPTSLVDVSSIDIRRKLKENVPTEELDKLMPSPVREYIKHRKLYV